MASRRARLLLGAVLVGLLVLVVSRASGGSHPPSAPLEREYEAPIQTDSLVYTAVYEARANGDPLGQRHGMAPDTFHGFRLRIAASFVNTTADTVVLELGGQSPRVRLVPETSPPSDERERQVGYLGSHPWGNYGDVAVAPGATRTDTLEWWGPQFWQAPDGDDAETLVPDGPLEGRMRLVYEQRAYYPPGVNPNVGGAGVYAPTAALTSNAFEVRLSRDWRTIAPSL